MCHTFGAIIDNACSQVKEHMRIGTRVGEAELRKCNGRTSCVGKVIHALVAVLVEIIHANLGESGRFLLGTFCTQGDGRRGSKPLTPIINAIFWASTKTLHLRGPIRMGKTKTWKIRLEKARGFQEMTRRGETKTYTCIGGAGFGGGALRCEERARVVAHLQVMGQRRGGSKGSGLGGHCRRLGAPCVVA